MKYIVKWKVSNTYPTACPDYTPDPYTGQYPSTHCLVYHCETRTEEKFKEFETKEAAEEFKNKAPSNCSDFVISSLTEE